MGLVVFFIWEAQGSAKSSQIEYQCRLKAKETAAEQYKSCVTDKKQAEVKRIKNEYEQKLSHLKSNYEEQMSQLASSKKGKRQQITVDTPLPTEELAPEVTETY